MKSGLCAGAIAEWHASLSLDRPLIVGISGVQGCGKSHMLKELTKILSTCYGLVAQGFSLDDMYLSHAEQNELSEQFCTDPLLQLRGNPGTHDLSLYRETLDNLIHNRVGTIPRYNKDAFNGLGDRHDHCNFTEIDSGSVSVILVEGWMVGFKALETVSPELVNVNSNLKNYESLWDMFDGFIHMRVEDISVVYEWRFQAEKTMDQTLTNDFISRFMPAYNAYLPRLNNEPIVEGKHLQISLGQDREFVRAMLM